MFAALLTGRRQSQAKAVEIEQKALAEQALENVQKEEEEDLESIKKEEEFQRNEEETAVEEATIAV